MNDEIKEILDDLLFTTTLPNVSIKLNKEKLNQLKDYITDLQQELEHLDKVNCHLRKKINNDVYKSRCEKAVEILGRYKHLSSPTEEQAIEQEEIVENAYDTLNGKE